MYDIGDFQSGVKVGISCFDFENQMFKSINEILAEKDFSTNEEYLEAAYQEFQKLDKQVNYILKIEYTIFDNIITKDEFQIMLNKYHYSEYNIKGRYISKQEYIEYCTSNRLIEGASSSSDIL